MNTTRKIITTFLTAGVLSGAAIGTALADFPDQAYGDLSGDVPVPVRELTSARPGKNLLILPFIGDWNGTAKKGFPHQ